MSVLYPNLCYNKLCYKGILCTWPRALVYKNYLLLLWTLCCGPYGFTLDITDPSFDGL